MSKYTKAIRMLAKMNALDADITEKLLKAHIEEDGGPGSGNFGHKGRPGKRGGSSKEGGGSANGSSPSGRSYSTFPQNGAAESNPSMFSRKKVGGSNKTADPTGGAMSEAQREFRKKDLKNKNMEMADKCFYNAQKPEYAEVKSQLDVWANVLSRPQAGRPTPEESKALIEKKLSKVSPKLKPYFKEVYKKRLEDEPNITNDLCDIADSLGAEMYGLNYRLKSADEDGGHCRAAEKIAEDMDEKGWTYEQAVDNFSDMVRYTQACTTDTLVNQYEKTMSALEKKGYKIAKVKNTWESYNKDKPYRGVNCVMISPNGTRFELQFHTPESIVGKEIQHPWYEEFRAEGVDPKRKDVLGEKMFRNMDQLKAPKNIGRISDYPPKGYD